MVKSCCVFRCTNRADITSKEKSISFFRFPVNKHKRYAWTRAINRKNWTPTNHTYICSEHFVGGWHSDDPADINYGPSVFSYKECSTNMLATQRQHRLEERNDRKTKDKDVKIEETTRIQHMQFTMECHSLYCATAEDTSSEKEVKQLEYDDTDVKTFASTELGHTGKILDRVLVYTGIQCDPDPLFTENLKLKQEVKKLRQELEKRKWAVEKIVDTLTKFYTGLPAYSIFLWLFNYVAAKSSRMTYWTGNSSTPSGNKSRFSTTVLRPVDQFLSFLIRNRLGLLVQDISDRFATLSFSGNDIQIGRDAQEINDDLETLSSILLNSGVKNVFIGEISLRGNFTKSPGVDFELSKRMRNSINRKLFRVYGKRCIHFKKTCVPQGL
ncbi:hypothetical protein KUTeg_012281 [Tegillarca granosa]|uniref:THAP-type domain-containing protein n=1 Tax=Tegillarca granosa TaxID=220873 RepID=A0ABQ9EZ30_TEGGR|nr:hypothetical protein KUTeg_012281 [Tegillarca granosa]